MREIKIKNGRYEALILDQGAILCSFSVDGHDVVLGFENIEDNIESDSYLGQIVGPYANRICDAVYSDENGEHRVEKNDGKNHLHSGNRNYGWKTWGVKEITESSVTLTLYSPESYGYPGNQEVCVKYSLSLEGVLRLDYSIKGDKKCPLNPTNHAFFNLSGSGDIRDTVVTMDADEYLEVDSTLIPTEIKSVESTDFDFRSPKALRERRNGAYDHCFVIKEGGKVRVENKEYALEMTTSLPGMQLYTGEFLNRKEKGKNGTVLSPFTGFCMETEYYPDFPNRPDFKGFWLDGMNEYVSWTEYRLIKK